MINAALMRKRQALFLFILAFLMVVFLTGCGRTAVEKNTEEPDMEKTWETVDPDAVLSQSEAK